MFWAIHWSNPKNTYFGPICFWLFIGAILRIHILVQYVLGLICFGSNMFWYEYVLGTICFGMNMFWSNMFPNMFWAQYVFVQYVLARHGSDRFLNKVAPRELNIPPSMYFSMHNSMVTSKILFLYHLAILLL